MKHKLRESQIFLNNRYFAPRLARIEHAQALKVNICEEEEWSIY